MAQIGDLNEFTEGTKIQALALNSNYVEISNKYNAHENAITDVHGVSSPNYIISKNFINELFNKYFPVGSLKYVWDNNNTDIQALINSEYFTEMDGSVVEDSESIYNSQELPDLEGIYIIGTEDGDEVIGESTYEYSHSHSSITNASHSILSHTHEHSHKHNLGNSGYIGVGYSSASPTTVLRIRKRNFLNSPIVVPSSVDFYKGIGAIYESTTSQIGNYVVPLSGSTDYITYTSSSVSSNSSSSHSSLNIGSSTPFIPVNENIRHLKLRCFLRYK